METKFYSYQFFQSDIKHILFDMHKQKYTPDIIFGVPRGGLVPATFLSHQLSNEQIYIPVLSLDRNQARHYDPLMLFYPHLSVSSKILIVDDILDTGEAIEKISSYFSFYGIKDVKTAMLIWNESNKAQIKPDFFGRSINKEKDPYWVEFFWEQKL